MRVFPTTNLAIASVNISDAGDGAVNVSTNLTPFDLELADEEGPVTIHPTLSFVLPDLRGLTADRLENTVRRYPTNPDPGYIDGSIYIDARHHPVDISSIAFGAVHQGGLPIRCTSRVVLEFEGLADYGDFDWTFDVNLPIAAFDDIVTGRAQAKAAATKADRLRRKAAQAKAKRQAKL